jgi:hypothetical protein
VFLEIVLLDLSRPIAQANKIRKRSKKITEQGSSKVGLHPKHALQLVAEYKQKIDTTIKNHAQTLLFSIFSLFYSFPFYLAFNPRLINFLEL